MIDSRHFVKKEGHENPNVPFPYTEEIQQAPEVNMGLTFLKKESIDQLGKKKTTFVEWGKDPTERVTGANLKM